MEYVDCTLTFHNDREGEFADDRENTCRGKVGGDELGRRTVKTLKEWVQKYSEYCHRGELSLLGLHLYRIAFDTQPDPPLAPTDRPLKTAFEKTFRAFTKAREEDPEKRMRLKLVFKKETDEIAGHPWEFLCMPDGEDGVFLAQKAELILTRFVPMEKWSKALQPDKGDANLRILIVKAEPDELGTVAAEEVIKEIESLKDEHIDVKVFEGPATFKRLKGCISGSDEQAGYRPHILHFMGHGGNGELALMKDEAQLLAENTDAKLRRERNEKVERVKEARWIDMASVKSLFEFHKPRVVFLHACKGAAPDSLKTFSNTARELAYSQIPAVIAMQYDIENDEAQLFATTFYKQLRKGKHVDEAVTEARRELGGTLIKAKRNVWDDRSFGTPVIYLATEQPIILPPPAAKSSGGGQKGGADPQGGTMSGKVDCPNGGCDSKVRYGCSFCTRCKKALMVCPTCHVMMVTETGMCDNGHGLDSAPAVRAAASELGAFEPTPERKRLNI